MMKRCFFFSFLHFIGICLLAYVSIGKDMDCKWTSAVCIFEPAYNKEDAFRNEAGFVLGVEMKSKGTVPTQVPKFLIILYSRALWYQVNDYWLGICTAEMKYCKKSKKCKLNIILWCCVCVVCMNMMLHTLLINPMLMVSGQARASPIFSSN